jgi:hypothetical protein
MQDIRKKVSLDCPFAGSIKKQAIKGLHYRLWFSLAETILAFNSYPMIKPIELM